MSARNDGGPAFPFVVEEEGCETAVNRGMTLRDWFAGTLPAPTEGEINDQMNLDKHRNPYNEPHRPRIRDRAEIVAMLRWRAADAMIAARSK